MQSYYWGVSFNVTIPDRCWRASSLQTSPSSHPFGPGVWGGWGGHCWLGGGEGRTAVKHQEKTGQNWKDIAKAGEANAQLWVKQNVWGQYKCFDSQSEVLSFLSHDADSALFWQDRWVLVAYLLIEQHVGIPVPPAHIGVWIGCTQTQKISGWCLNKICYHFCHVYLHWS